MTAVSHSSLECALTGFGSEAVLWSSRVYNVAWRRERARSLAFYVFAVLMIEQTESGNQSQNISTPLPLVSLPSTCTTHVCSRGSRLCSRLHVTGTARRHPPRSSGWGSISRAQTRGKEAQIMFYANGCPYWYEKNDKTISHAVRLIRRDN